MSEEYTVEQKSRGKKVDPRSLNGEVKVALSIRLLAGGSYLDLVPLFGVSTSHLYTVFDDFVDQVLQVFDFPLVGWLRQRNWEALEALANAFAEKTDGVFYGPFAAIDGLAVRIRSPTLKEVADPGNYYCRKGFFALNVQAICDKYKRFLWSFPSNKGSTHDATAFGHSKLLELLKQMAAELREQGIFIVGDAAYALAPFLLIPFGLQDLLHDRDGAKDSFNFHLSSCRIYIECAFGELVMRWGIFWRTLQFDLRKSTKVIQVAMLLHNFIIENRENGVSDNNYFATFRMQSQMDTIQDRITDVTGEFPHALVTDNNEPRPPGRQSLTSAELDAQGSNLRSILTTNLAVHGLRRPMQYGMRYNHEGHVYIVS
jgi:hypothetical protein